MTRIPIDDITVPEGRRALRDVSGLADSIRELGLLNPITVTPARVLVAGRHRLEACRLLGWLEVPAEVLDLDELHAQLAEIDENLIRHDLTALERGEHMARRKEVYEALHPTAKHGGAPGKAGGGKAAKDEIISSFAADTASKAGVTPRTVQQEVQFATAIPTEVKEMIRETPLADNKTALLQLARIPEGDQKEVAEVAVKESVSVPVARARVRRRKKGASFRSRGETAPLSNGKPPWEVICDDCIKVMRGMEAGSARLIFADPPYNIGVNYGGGKKADLLPEDEFLDWTEAWILQAASLLADDGSMWVLINDEYADHVGIFLRNAELHRRNWIKWFESFGENTTRKFNRTSRHLFYCVKDPKRFVFNPEAVSRPSDRQEKYNDSRADPDGKLWDDVWGIKPPIPRLVENAGEHLPGFPTQLPLALLRPIVGCASEPGDLVLDPFAGSGTTGHAALELGRRFLGIERNPEFAEMARFRLSDVKGGSGEIAG